MGGKSEYKAFRSLLRRAIGPHRTQAEFAQEAGISVEHVNRMLNSDVISQPKIATLQKIAGHAYDGITLSELKNACGYDATRDESDDRIIAKRRSMTPQERAQACIGDIQVGISQLSSKSPAYASLYSFLDMLVMLFAVEDLSFDIGEPIPVDNEKHPFASHAVVVTMSFAEHDFSAKYDFALYYAKSSEGKKAVFVLGAAFDYPTLSSLNSCVARDLERFPESHSALNHLDTVCVIKHSRDEGTERASDPSRLYHALSQKAHELEITKGLSPKDAFFQAFFGDPDRPTRVSTVEGFGFYIDTTPEYIFRKFLQKHKETFCRSDEERRIFEAIATDDKSLSDIFVNYDSDTHNSGFGHWGVAIVNIIYRETGINLELWEDDDGDRYGLDNRTCVMLPTREPWHMNDVEKELSLSSATQILDRYAIDLRTEVDTDVYFTMKIDL